jgi:hypothetical protein
MMVSSERIFWYLFNGFLHINKFVVELFFPAKMLEMSPAWEVVKPPHTKIIRPPPKTTYCTTHNKKMYHMTPVENNIVFSVPYA